MQAASHTLALLLLASAVATSAVAKTSENACAISRGPGCDIGLAVKRGMFETGLRPVFPKGTKCREIDDHWAISYTFKRDREAYHGGIDIPAPFGTPIIATADGEVIAVFKGKNSYRGKEIVIRHSPAQTGLRHWTFTAYSHFKTMPRLKVGAKVKLGQVLGSTGNSGRGKIAGVQSKKRRPAIHFSVVYSAAPGFVISKNNVVVPKNARWADPNAFLSGQRSLDSRKLRAMPKSKKQVPVGIMLKNGTVIPAGVKIVWPYYCKR